MEQNYKYLRLFPLNLVVFPNESLNLHIFEPRYKQLIKECLETGDTFGIPVFKNKKIAEYGTEIEILSLEKTYSGGEMDIKTRGLKTFIIEEVMQPDENRLYHAANIKYTRCDDSEDDNLRIKLEDMIDAFFDIVSPNTDLDFNKTIPLSNLFGHKVGLSFEQEYELLKMETEYERQNYMFTHLKNILPVLEETERLKERIKQNGHFKKLTAPKVA